MKKTKQELYEELKDKLMDVGDLIVKIGATPALYEYRDLSVPYNNLVDVFNEKYEVLGGIK